MAAIELWLNCSKHTTEGLRGRNLIPELIASLDTLYNALTLNDQEFIELRSSGNFWTKCLAKCLKNLESKSKVRSNTVLRQLLPRQENQASAQAKRLHLSKSELSCVTVGCPFSPNCPATHCSNVYRLQHSDMCHKPLQLITNNRKAMTRGTKSKCTFLSQSTAPVQPPVGPEPITTPVLEPIVAPVVAPVPNTKPSVSLPYPSRRDNEKSQSASPSRVCIFGGRQKFARHIANELDVEENRSLKSLGSPDHCVPKKEGMTVGSETEENELITTRLDMDGEVAHECGLTLVDRANVKENFTRDEMPQKSIQFVKSLTCGGIGSLWDRVPSSRGNKYILVQSTICQNGIVADKRFPTQFCKGHAVISELLTVYPPLITHKQVAQVEVQSWLEKESLKGQLGENRASWHAIFRSSLRTKPTGLKASKLRSCNYGVIPKVQLMNSK
ncbi:hypothetical protein Tco_1409807 [Tanacetum coccineum]